MAANQNHRVVLGHAADGEVVADGLRFVRAADHRGAIVIDQTHPLATRTGAWWSSNWTGAGPPHGGTYAVHDFPDGSGAASHTWTPPVPYVSTYTVYARWVAWGSHAPNAQYVVHHAGGSTTVQVDQRYNGSVWNHLGDFPMAPGQNHRVVLIDNAAPSSHLIADAVMIKPGAVLPPAKYVAADSVKLVANDAEIVKYVHADHLGSPQKMTDATGAVIWHAAYTPFGQTHTITGADSNNQRFPGQYFDGEKGLHYNYWRDYDPTTGRYLQSDPIGAAGWREHVPLCEREPDHAARPLRFAIGSRYHNHAGLSGVQPAGVSAPASPPLADLHPINISANTDRGWDLFREPGEMQAGGSANRSPNFPSDCYTTRGSRYNFTRTRLAGGPGRQHI